MTDAHNQRGMELVTYGEHDAAIDEFRLAIEADASSAECHANLGLTLLLRNHSDQDVKEAIVTFHEALRLDRCLSIVYGYLGAAYSLLYDDAKAIDYLLRGLAEPSAFVLRHLCLVYFRNGRWYEVIAYCDALLDFDPEDATARFNRALALLTLGDYNEGYRDFEYRDLTQEAKARNIARDQEITHLALWRGEDIHDKHLVLHAEGGMGDSFQFARFIPDLADRCAKLSIYERQDGRALLREAFASDKIVIVTAIPSDADYYTLTMSAGIHLGLNATNIHRLPYIKAPLTMEWHDRYAHLFLPRVGISWAGRSDYTNDIHRSIQLAYIARLFDAPVSWISLQIPQDPLCPIYDAAPFLHDWSDTAAAIDALDLVITVDTAIAHLAGAMGKPVWLLNRFDTCWRWGRTGETTPWYPSMRIFRQPAVGDWDSVLTQVLVELETWIEPA